MTKEEIVNIWNWFHKNSIFPTNLLFSSYTGPEPRQKAAKTGKNRTINGVSILGPLRRYNQVEISLTDARTLGITVPVRESGDIEGSAPITIENPVNGKRLELKEGLIAAKRHIHMTPKDAEDFGVKNGDIVSVKITGTGRETTFGDTVIRVSDKFALAMHIDTDESNAACASGVIYGELIK